MNFLAGTLRRDADGAYSVQLGKEVLHVPPSVLTARPALAGHVDAPITIGIRPEDIEDASLAGTTEGQTLVGQAELVEPLGSDLMVHISTDAPAATESEDMAELAKEVDPLGTGTADSVMIARFSPRSPVRLGEKVTVWLATERLHFFEPTSGIAIWND
jgi:multiple sugar transport system ATP-binding protein